MTRCYLDTNFLYVHFRQHNDADVVRWRQAVEMELGGDFGVISTLVLDELAYRSVLGWLRDRGDKNPITTFRRSTSDVMHSMRKRLERLWTAIDELELELAVADKSVAARATALMSEPGLAPRDAFHAAHALECGCEVIVSSDPDYDRVLGLRRLAPTAAP